MTFGPCAIAVDVAAATVSVAVVDRSRHTIVGRAEASAALFSSTSVTSPGPAGVAAGTTGIVHVTALGAIVRVPTLGFAVRKVEPVGALTLTTAPEIGAVPGLLTVMVEG